MVGDNDAISLAEAAKDLRLKGAPEARAKRLKRILVAKEAVFKVTIITRTFGANGSPRYWVTRRMLKRYCREYYVRSAGELTQDFKRYLDRIPEVVDERIDLIVGPQIDELRAVDEELLSGLKRLAEKVERLATRPSETRQNSTPQKP